MADLKSLMGRLDTEFEGFRQTTEKFQADAKDVYEAREARFRNQFVPAAERVVEIARPRLELLIERFKSGVDVVPVVTEHHREVTLKFNSPLARVHLRFQLGHDAEVKNLVLEQDLEILPILMQYDSRDSLTMPLDKVDDGKIAKWIDDRIVSSVQAVASMHQNQNYLKAHLVMDPVANVQLPKFAAKCTLEAGGKTYYFISEATKNEFEKSRKTGSK